MDDLISRQSALNEINHGVPVKGWEDSERVWELINIFVNRIKQLPSIQPEIIRCKDCKNWDTTWVTDLMKDYNYCPLHRRNMHSDWYCADAERKTNE